jgi:hypothetical protein
MTKLVDIVRAEWNGAGGADYYTGSDEDTALDMMSTDYALFRLDPHLSEVTAAVETVRLEDERIEAAQILSGEISRYIDPTDGSHP